MKQARKIIEKEKRKKKLTKKIIKLARKIRENEEKRKEGKNTKTGP